MQAYDYAPFQRNFNSIKVRLKRSKNYLPYD